MANTLTFLGVYHNMPGTAIKRYACTLSGSYANGGAVGTPGETLSFNTALNPNKLARPKLVGATPGSGRIPSVANGDFQVVNAPTGIIAQIENNAVSVGGVVSVLPSNMVMRLFGGGSGAAEPAELASATYASYGLTLTNAIIIIEVNLASKYV
jgi:hypothetical protein